MEAIISKEYGGYLISIYINNNTITLYDDENDFELSIDIKYITNIIDYLNSTFEGYKKAIRKGFYIPDDTSTSSFVYEQCGGGHGNFVTISRIPFIVEILYEFEILNGKVDKSKIKKEIIEKLSIDNLKRIYENMR